MEVVLEATHVQSQGLMCPYHLVGSRACSSLGRELVSEEMETRPRPKTSRLSHPHISHPRACKGISGPARPGLPPDRTPAQGSFLRDLVPNISIQWPVQNHLALNSWCKPLNLTLIQEVVNLQPQTLNWGS